MVEVNVVSFLILTGRKMSYAFYSKISPQFSKNKINIQSLLKICLGEKKRKSSRKIANNIYILIHV